MNLTFLPYCLLNRFLPSHLNSFFSGRISYIQACNDLVITGPHRIEHSLIQRFQEVEAPVPPQMLDKVIHSVL